MLAAIDETDGDLLGHPRDFQLAAVQLRTFWQDLKVVMSQFGS